MAWHAGEAFRKPCGGLWAAPDWKKPVEEFGRKLKMYAFSGLPPQRHMTVHSQLAEFSRQTARQLGIENFTFSDWGDAFNQLAQYTAKGPIIIFFDEIPWMGSCDPDFLNKLKNAWDTEFKKNDHFTLILCGSVLTRIDKNILSNTEFFGRILLKIHLKEPPIKDCDLLWLQQTIILLHMKNSNY